MPATEEMPQVITFRYQWLVHTGFSKSNAIKIAERTDIDWHTACEIFEACRKKGYDEEFVMNIIL